MKELPDARSVAKAKAVESEGSIGYNKIVFQLGGFR
jgi:hypothetical protein